MSGLLQWRDASAARRVAITILAVFLLGALAAGAAWIFSGKSDEEQIRELIEDASLVFDDGNTRALAELCVPVEKRDEIVHALQNPALQHLKLVRPFETGKIEIDGAMARCALAARAAYPVIRQGFDVRVTLVARKIDKEWLIDYVESRKTFSVR